MPRKRPEPACLLRAQLLKYQAQIANHRSIDGPRRVIDDMPSLEQRLQEILDITNSISRPPTNMLFFVMYDITSNKVRRAVVKYLARMGCHRVQKSIFLADVSAEKCRQIQSDLAQVQAMYENDDSIFIVPLSVDYVRSMKVIGKNVDFDLIMHSASSMFF